MKRFSLKDNPRRDKDCLTLARPPQVKESPTQTLPLKIPCRDSAQLLKQ